MLSVFICSGWELREQLQWRHSLDAVGALPQKGGVKDYAPDGSWLQARKLENFYSERLSILREERVRTKSVFACSFFPIYTIYWNYTHVLNFFTDFLCALVVTPLLLFSAFV